MTKSANPQSVGVEKIVKSLRSLNACDPCCEGRCRECPDDIGRQAASTIEHQLSVIGEYETALNEIKRISGWDNELFKEASAKIVARVGDIHQCADAALSHPIIGGGK